MRAAPAATRPPAAPPVAAPPVALTMGDPAGIGGEIALKAWLRRDDPGLDRPPCFFAIDDAGRLAALAQRFGLAVPVETIAEPAEAPAAFPRALPVLPCPLAVASTPGEPDGRNAPPVLASIRTAVALSRSGAAAGLVTNPIHKRTLYAAGFPHPGHTEFLGELAGGLDATMMLACPGLRVVPLTVHMPLRLALDGVTREAIVACGLRVAESLKRDFDIPRPRIAVAGLNPHAGEGGSLGREEIDTVAPAVAELQAAGIDATGPYSPDSMFHEGARALYDVALCLYHDQGLIPLKTIDFVRGVNITLGLPFVRTSPDHGTAFDIAGRGVADERSLIAALRTADEIAGRRARTAVAAPA